MARRPNPCVVFLLAGASPNDQEQAALAALHFKVDSLKVIPNHDHARDDNHPGADFFMAFDPMTVPQHLRIPGRLWPAQWALEAQQ